MFLNWSNGAPYVGLCPSFQKKRPFGIFHCCLPNACLSMISSRLPVQWVAGHIFPFVPCNYNNVTMTLSNNASLWPAFLASKNGTLFVQTIFDIRTLIVTWWCVPSNTRRSVPMTELKTWVKNKIFMYLIFWLCWLLSLRTFLKQPSLKF